ncbi:hypothetical protein ABZP36_029706 [Zizania latifolia]
MAALLCPVAAAPRGGGRSRRPWLGLSLLLPRGITSCGGGFSCQGVLRKPFQVVSFQTFLDLRHTYDGKLSDTVFRCHPFRSKGKPFSTFYDIEHEKDTTIVHMARMIESMDDIYTLRERESKETET